MKAGGQGAGHHSARPRPFTAACRHGLASSQECFTYLPEVGTQCVAPPHPPGGGGYMEGRLALAFPEPPAGQEDTQEDTSTHGLM